MSPRAARPWLLTTTLAVASAGCGAETGQSLDRSYQLATARLEEVEEREADAEAEAETPLAAPLDRDAVVALAVRRSPALAVMAHRARAMVHAGRAEGSLPTSELGFEVWNLPLTRPYDLGEADMYMVELRQRFPAAGARDARARAMAEEAAAMLAEVASEERRVAQAATDAFVEYEQAVAERGLQQEQRALLDRMGHVIRARYSTGGSALAEAVRVELEVARTDRALSRVDAEIARARSVLNSLLRRPAAAPLPEPRVAPPETVRLSIDELVALAEAHRGPSLAADARARAATARREAADAEARVPEFMLGLGYWQDPGMRPGLGITASMSLPWFWGPQRHLAAQAAEDEAALRAGSEESGIETATELHEAHAGLAALEAQLVDIDQGSLPSAHRAVDALTAAYTTGSASLLEWVDAARAVLDLEMEAVALRGELARSVAALERAVGAPLPRVALGGEDGR